jgi:hypothetical protein
LSRAATIGTRELSEPVASWTRGSSTMLPPFFSGLKKGMLRSTPATPSPRE